jgi:hypothetical protein
MKITSILLVTALLLSFVYIVMTFVAWAHVKPEKRDKRGVNRVFALTLWWPFYEDLYDDAALRLCRYGKLLIPVITVLYIAYFVLVAR